MRSNDPDTRPGSGWTRAPTPLRTLRRIEARRLWSAVAPQLGLCALAADGCKTLVVSDWGTKTFGEPCRECGYRWTRDTTAAVELIESVPDAFGELLAAATGQESVADLDWNVSAYTAHVVDNLRIWAERLAALAAGNDVSIVAYDDNALATARGYPQLPLAGSLWSLERSVQAWLDAFHLAEDGDLIHPVRGRITVNDVASTNAHDTAHHYFDIGRCLTSGVDGATPSPMPGST